MKTRTLVVVTLWSLTLLVNRPRAARAADAPHAAEPAVWLQVKSAHELVQLADSTAKNFLPDPAYQQFQTEVLQHLDVSRVTGIDPQKPFGMYAIFGDGLLQGDLSKSIIAILIPIKDEATFLLWLKQSNLPAAKNGEQYALAVPNFPLPVMLAFEKGYARIFLTTATDHGLTLEPQQIIEANETAAACLHVRFDRVPVDLKKTYLTNVTRALEAQIERFSAPPNSAANAPFDIERESAFATTRLGLRWAALAFNEGRELIVKADLNPKTGSLSAEFSMEAEKGTELATSIAGLPPTKNRFASLVGPKDAMSMLVQAPLSVPEVRQFASKMLEQSIAEMVQTQKTSGPDAISQTGLEAAQAALRSVKAGEMELAVSLRGLDQEGNVMAVAAVTLKDTAALETAFRTESVKHFDVKLDVEKVNQIGIHQITLPETEFDSAMRQFVGKSPICIAFAPNAVLCTIGTDAHKTLREILKTNKLAPQPAPLLQEQIWSDGIANLFKSLHAPPEAFAFLDKLSHAQPSTLMRFNVAGGEKLTVQAELGLPALWIALPKAAAR
ncbi:MAG TPA: hypothetical protein VFE24_17610 [Pirellulales bacterium]|jgi:hypothetical protein|nr:hypothetical protein [Pirellulales bacterium]